MRFIGVWDTVGALGVPLSFAGLLKEAGYADGFEMDLRYAGKPVAPFTSATR